MFHSVSLQLQWSTANKKVVLYVVPIQYVQAFMETSRDFSSDDGTEDRPENVLALCSIRENHLRQTGYLQVVCSYSDRGFLAELQSKIHRHGLSLKTLSET